jgi:hypothetical protein
VHHVLVAKPEAAALWWVEPPQALDLFRFIDGKEANYRHGLETGLAPWYMSPRVRIAFLRPLASLTHAIDHTLLAGMPWAMHIHSLAWLFALGWAVARLVRRIETGWVAGLIVLFYVFDAGHGIPAGWLANRNPMIAGVFGALALQAHIRWRLGLLKTPVWPLALILLSTLAGESMVTWGALHFAFALTIDPGGVKRGLIALAPLTTLVVIWRVIYSALGYGASGSGLYVDPVGEPLKFMVNVVRHLPQLLAGQMGGPPAGVFPVAGPAAERAGIALATIVVVIFLLATQSMMRQHAKVRFWALAALLASIPVCATVPNGRLMLAGGLGVQGVIVHFLAHVVEQLPATRWRRGLAAFWLLLLGGLSPPMMAFSAYAWAIIARPSRLAIESVPSEATGRTLVVVTIPDPMFMCTQLPIMLVSLERPRPKQLRCLAAVERAAEVHREDAHTLVVRNPDGLLSSLFVPLVRAPDDPFPQDWSLEVSDARFEIAERDPAGQPLALRVRFTVPLEDESLVFVAWSPQDERLVPFPLPAVGQTAHLEGQKMVDLF